MSDWPVRSGSDLVQFGVLAFCVGFYHGIACRSRDHGQSSALQVRYTIAREFLAR